MFIELAAPSFPFIVFFFYLHATGGKKVESDPSLNGLCLKKTEKMNAHSDHKVNVDFIFPSFPHHLQDGMVEMEEHETRD